MKKTVISLLSLSCFLCLGFAKPPVKDLSVPVKDSIKAELIDYMSTLDLIDAHEHLNPESVHLTNEYSFYWWFIPYVQYDLYGAGMPAQYIWRVPDSPEMVDQYWNTIEPLWQSVKHGAYGRCVLLALKEFYGMDDITRENYKELGEKMNATRYLGRYKEILQDRCRIQYILNQNPGYKGDGFAMDHVPLNTFLTADVILNYKEKTPSATLEGLIDSLRAVIREGAAEGAVLAKFDASFFVSAPDKEKAEEEFHGFSKGSVFLHQSILGGYVYDELLKTVGETGMKACIHTGVWGDINIKNPLILYPVVERHPTITFDVMHMGMPFLNECGYLGKNYPNVYLNLSWSHIVSPQMCIEGLDQWLDYVPTNKIFAFGGDYINLPELVWAHLEMAKVNFAEVFSRRILRGELTMDDSKQILKAWFYDNPARVYGF